MLLIPELLYAGSKTLNAQKPAEIIKIRSSLALGQGDLFIGNACKNTGRHFV